MSVAPFVRVDNILNKINFAIGGFNQCLEYTDTDKGYLSGGIQILEEIYDELVSIKEELQNEKDSQHGDQTTNIPTVRIIQPAEKSIEQKSNLDTKSLNLPNIIDTSKHNAKVKYPIPDTPTGFNTISGLEKLELPKPNIIEPERPTSVVPPTNVDIVPNQFDPPTSSGYKLSPEETIISIIESDILEYLASRKDEWSNITQICKGVNKVRATVNKYIKMLSEKGFVIQDVVPNRKGNIINWKLDRKYLNDLDRLDFITKLAKK